MLVAFDWTWSRLSGIGRGLLPLAAVAAVGVLVFGWLCDAVGDHDGVTSVDQPVSVWVAAHRSVTAGDLGLLLARATGPAVLVFLVLLTAGVLWWRRARFEAVVLAVSVAVAYGVGGLAKIGEHRARPAAPVNLAPEAEGSFPSGHVLIVATIAIVAVALAGRHLGRAGRVLAVAAGSTATLVMGADRVLVGAHWLTDVAGSMALAAVIGSLGVGVLLARPSGA